MVQKMCSDSRWITKDEWKKLSTLDESDRPIVLRIDDRRGIMEIRPRRFSEKGNHGDSASKERNEN